MLRLRSPRRSAERTSSDCSAVPRARAGARASTRSASPCASVEGLQGARKGSRSTLRAGSSAGRGPRSTAGGRGRACAPRRRRCRVPQGMVVAVGADEVGEQLRSTSVGLGAETWCHRGSATPSAGRSRDHAQPAASRAQPRASTARSRCTPSSPGSSVRGDQFVQCGETRDALGKPLAVSRSPASFMSWMRRSRSSRRRRAGASCLASLRFVLRAALPGCPATLIERARARHPMSAADHPDRTAGARSLSTDPEVSGSQCRHRGQGPVSQIAPGFRLEHH